MACVLKSKTKNSPGIISFTTQEEKLIRQNRKNLNLFNKLKKSYLTCLHFNWHNFNYYPDDLFDIHLAGKTDLLIKNKMQINLFDLDACNFCPSFFSRQEGEKHWDVLYVARSVFFKGIPDFFQSIRELYNKGIFFRVLFLCPVPPDKKNDYKKLRKNFENLFNQKERHFFNFLPLKEDYPFFFDLETLSFFYKNSKIFVHTAPEERRCRVAAYAFACGLPVVGKENVGSILEDEYRIKPFFYKVTNNDFSTQILLSLNSYKSKNTPNKSLETFQSINSEKKIKLLFKNYFKKKGLSLEGKWYCKNLDLRLGSHFGLGEGPNFYSKSMEGFLKDMMNQETIKGILKDDFEKELVLSSSLGNGERDSLKISYILNNKFQEFLGFLKKQVKKLTNRLHLHF